MAHVSIREKIAYALGDAASNIAWRGVASFLFIVYTDVFGLNPAAVGTLMLVARVGDGISDIAIGVAADRTRTRWGRFRPWILWTALPLAATLCMTFTCPAGLGPTGRLAYAYVTYILFTLVYTAMNIPYGALLSVMTPDERERTSIGGWRMAGAFAGGMLVQGLLLALKDWTGSYTAPIYMLSAVMALILPVTFFGTRERVEPPPSQKNDLRRDFGDLLLRNAPWLVLLAVSLSYNVYNSVKQGVTVVYFTHYVHRELLAGTFSSPRCWLPAPSTRSYGSAARTRRQGYSRWARCRNFSRRYSRLSVSLCLGTSQTIRSGATPAARQASCIRRRRSP